MDKIEYIKKYINENNLDVSDNNHMNHLDKKFHSKFINNIKMYLMLIFY